MMKDFYAMYSRIMEGALEGAWFVELKVFNEPDILQRSWIYLTEAEAKAQQAYLQAHTFDEALKVVRREEANR